MGRPSSRRLPLAVAAAVALALAFGVVPALRQPPPGPGVSPPDTTLAPSTAPSNPVWTTAAWPFPPDAWGKGKVFRCRSEHCGTEIVVYLRAKVGMCGCISSIDDDGVERGSDLDLLAADRTAQGPGRPIAVRWMKGRSRIFALHGNDATPKSAVAVAFHDRCDMIVATAAVADAHAQRQEPSILELLNSDPVLRWAEVTLGL